MKRIGRLILAAIPAALVSGAPARQDRAPEPWKKLQPGFDKFIERKYEEAVNLWLKGSTLPDRTRAPIVRALRQRDVLFGPPSEILHVRTLRLTDRIALVSAVVHHPRAAAYLLFTMFETDKDGWLVTEFQYDPNTPYVAGKSLREQDSKAWAWLKPAFDQILQRKYESAFRSIIKNSPIEPGSEKKIARFLAGVESAFGKPIGRGFIRSFAPSEKTEIVYAATYHETGTCFFRFNCYRTKDTWVVTTVQPDIRIRGIVADAVWQVP